MNIDLIDIEFRKMIMVSGAYKKLGISHQHQKLLRNHLRRGLNISLNKKIRLLQKYGSWKNDDYIFTRKNMVDFGTFILRASESAKQLGPHYLLEKFNSQQPQKANF